jgi:hypothetical protein
VAADVVEDGVDEADVVDALRERDAAAAAGVPGAADAGRVRQRDPVLAEVVQPEADRHLAGAADVLVQHDEQRGGGALGQVERRQQEVRPGLLPTCTSTMRLSPAGVPGPAMRTGSTGGVAGTGSGGTGSTGTGGGTSAEAACAAGRARREGPPGTPTASPQDGEDGCRRPDLRPHRRGCRVERRVQGARRRRRRSSRRAVEQVATRNSRVRRVASSLTQPWPFSSTSCASTLPPRQSAQRRTSSSGRWSDSGSSQPALRVNRSRLSSTGAARGRAPR